MSLSEKSWTSQECEVQFFVTLFQKPGKGVQFWRMRVLRLEDFVFPYGQLDKNNEWVRLSDLVPWYEAEMEKEFGEALIVKNFKSFNQVLLASADSERFWLSRTF